MTTLGVVKFFRRAPDGQPGKSYGWGILAELDGSREVFVHAHVLHACGLHTLKPGWLVEFEAAQRPGRPGKFYAAAVRLAAAQEGRP